MCALRPHSLGPSGPRRSPHARIHSSPAFSLTEARAYIRTPCGTRLIVRRRLTVPAASDAARLKVVFRNSFARTKSTKSIELRRSHWGRLCSRKRSHFSRFPFRSRVRPRKWRTPLITRTPAKRLTSIDFSPSRVSTDARARCGTAAIRAVSIAIISSVSHVRPRKSEQWTCRQPINSIVNNEKSIVDKWKRM